MELEKSSLKRPRVNEEITHHDTSPAKIFRVESLGTKRGSLPIENAIPSTSSALPILESQQPINPNLVPSSYSQLEQPPDSLGSKVQEYEYKKRGGTAGIGGHFYETKLLTLILIRALNNNEIDSFYLGTNVDGIGAFDDIICRLNLKGEGKPRVIFIQTKHVDDPEMYKVTDGKLIKEDGGFSLNKYFDSYLKIKEKFNPNSNDDIFKGKFQNIDCDFIIYTSANEGIKSKNIIEPLDLIYTSKEGKTFHFDYKDYDFGLLIKSASKFSTKLLAENLAKFILPDKDNYSNMMSDKLIKSYHVFLAQKVIEVSNLKSGNFCEGKLLPDFINSNEDLLSIFREELYKNIIKKSILQPKEIEDLVNEILKNLSADTISKLIGSVLTFDAKNNRLKFISKIPQEIIHLKDVLEKKKVSKDIVNKAIDIAKKEKLQSLSFKLPSTFGNLNFNISGNEAEREKILDHLVSKFIELFKNRHITSNNIIKIYDNMIGPENEKILKDKDIGMGGIEGLVGNLLILDKEETEMLKFNNDEGSLPENAKQLLKKLKSKIVVDIDLMRKNINLDNYRFEINVKGFPRLSLINKNLAIEFLDKVKFYTNQAKEDEVEKLVKQEIIKYYPQRGALFDIKYKAILLLVHDEVQSWWKIKKKAPYLTKECKYFEQVNKRIINSSLSTIQRYEIKKYSIEFEFDNNSIDKLRLQDFINDPNKQILNIITKEKLLSAIKLVQRYETSANFIDLGYSLSKDNDYFKEEVTEFKEGENNILVIQCNDIETEKIDVLYESLLSIANDKPTSNIILITQKNNTLATKLKDGFSTKYEERKDENNSLTDLTTESQDKILSKGQVIFQGKEISLDTLIDQKSKCLIGLEIISKLINNEKIKIGKAPRGLKYDKDYYIPQIFNHHVKINKNIKEQGQGRFFISYNSEVNESNLQLSQDFVVISDEYMKFKKLCETYKKHNIHWLKEERSDFIWQQSHGDLSKLHEFVDKNENNVKKYELKRITDITDRVVIIAADSGMGKSTVLTHLTVKTKEFDPSLWIVRINLLDHSQEFKKWNDKKINIDIAEAFKFLYRSMNFHLFRENGKQIEEQKEQIIKNILNLVVVENNEVYLKNSEEESIKKLNFLEIDLFNYFYNQGKITLLFDGFDEITPNYEKKIIELLKVLKATKVQKLWVTTRPYSILNQLESELGTFSYSLEPFSQENQKRFLEKFWKKNLELDELDNNLFSIFANELLERFSHKINDQERKFIGIPLHLSMIAKVFQNLFKEFYDSKSEDLSNECKQKLYEKLNLVTIYEHFIHIKFKEIRFKEKKPGMNTADPEVEDMIEEMYKKFKESHKKLAFYTIFKEDKLGKLLSKQEIGEINSLIENIKQGKEKTGIIDRIINGEPIFIHRTFAEYLAANYLWEKFKSIQFDKNFIDDIMIENIIEGDRIQVCKFFQLEAQKDLEKKVDFSDKEDKLNELLKKLISKTYRYGPYNDENSKQSTKLLLKIVEFSLSAKEGSEPGIISNVQNIESNEKFALLSVSAEMGYAKLANAIIGNNLNAEFLQKDLGNDKWFYSPLWLAAENGHLDVLQLLVEKLSYNSEWEDKDRETLLMRIFQRNNGFDVLRSCLKLDIVNVSRTYRDLNHEVRSLLVHCLGCHAPSDVIELLIEKTDINFINKFISPDGLPAVDFISCELLSYDKEITELAIKKGIDFSNINILLFEFTKTSLNNPINELRFSHLLKCSFYTDEEYLYLFDRIKLLLKNGVGYNYTDIEYQMTTLQYAEQIYYVHKLLDKVHKLHNQKKYKSKSPLGTILKLIINSLSRSDDFRGFKININSDLRQIYLSPNYNHESVQYDEDLEVFLPINNFELKLYDEEISLLSDYMTGLLNESDETEVSLDKLKSYISNAKEVIEKFKEYPDSKSYNIFSPYEDMLKKYIEQKSQYESLDKFVKDLLGRVLNLYIKQDYEIDYALKEVSEVVLKYRKVVNKLKTKSGCEINVCEIDRILDKLYTKNIDSNNELQDLMSKIYKCGGIKLLIPIWSKLNCIGQKNIQKTLKLMFKFSDQSSKIYELLKKLDNSFNKLTNAINNKNYKEINNILQNVEPDFIKAIINSQVDKYGSPLHYAAYNNEAETTKILLDYGANPNYKSEKNKLLLNIPTPVEEIKKLEFKLSQSAIYWTPLQLAVQNGCLEVVKALLNKGADVDVKSKGSGTPLHDASKNDYLEILEALLNKGANVNIKTFNGRTPLHYAAKNGYLRIVEALLNKGAEVNVKDYYSYTPLCLAQQNCHKEVIQVLELT